MPITEGDVVVRKQTGFSKTLDTKLMANLRGRVCRVINPDASFMVRFEGATQCVLQFADSIQKVTGDGPDCIDDPSCK